MSSASTCSPAWHFPVKKNAKLQRVNWKPVQETQFGKDTCRFIEGQRGALVMPKWFFCMLMVVSAPLSVSNFPLSSAATIFPSCLQRVIASLRNVCKLPLLLTVCVCDHHSLGRTLHKRDVAALPELRGPMCAKTCWQWTPTQWTCKRDGCAPWLPPRKALGGGPYTPPPNPKKKP